MALAPPRQGRCRTIYEIDDGRTEGYSYCRHGRRRRASPRAAGHPDLTPIPRSVMAAVAPWD